MIGRIRKRATFANAMGCIAVFVAIGGTSVAAVTLPRNSVGARQLKDRAVGTSELRRGAVTSRALRNGTVRLNDISRSTRRALAGQQGAVGPPGPPAVSLLAAINAAGEPVAGSVHSSEGVGVNKRLIGFSRSVQGCVPTATLARNTGSTPADPGPGRIVVGIEGNRVAVETYDANGTPTFLPFNLIVAC